MKPGAALRVTLRIDFESGSSVGPGKIALLEHIGACGSLSQAARELRLSYRRAWLLLDDLNRAFAQPVATTSVGGGRGGGSRLTEFAHELIENYRRVERAANVEAGRRLRALRTQETPGKPARASLRRPLNRALRRRATSEA